MALIPITSSRKKDLIGEENLVLSHISAAANEGWPPRLSCNGLLSFSFSRHLVKTSQNQNRTAQDGSRPLYQVLNAEKAYQSCQECQGASEVMIDPPDILILVH